MILSQGTFCAMPSKRLFAYLRAKTEFGGMVNMIIVKSVITVNTVIYKYGVVFSYTIRRKVKSRGI